MNAYNKGTIAIYRKAFLIYNPYAGRIRKRRRLIEDSLLRMRAAGHQIRALSTTGPGSAGGISKRCVERGADLVLVAGGDGTINEVANGMLRSSVPMGVLPGGTANVLAVETGIGTSMLAAASRLGEWIPSRIAVGMHSDGLERPPRAFLLMCGAGLDAHIVYHLNVSLKEALGKVSYWIGGFSQLGRRLPEFEVEVDGTKYRASFALVSRVRNYGGDLEIAPTISLVADEFEVVLFTGDNSFRYLRYMVDIATKSVGRTPGVVVLPARSVRLSAFDDSRVYTQVDGEYAGPLPVNIELAPASLTLLLPPEYRKRRAEAAPRQDDTPVPAGLR